MEYLLELPLGELIARADKVRQINLGQKFELCAIINAKSGLCTEDCKFCAQSLRHKTTVRIHPLRTKQEIFQSAKEAKSAGAEKFGIVTSGNSLNSEELAVITQAIFQIKNELGLSVCASLGALTKEQLGELKQSGLSRYHHNIETSRRFYSQIVSTHDFQERIDTIGAAKSSGLEVCSGGIIGIGESWQDRIDMALLLKQLEVDSVPINFLVPISGTALASQELISCNDAVRTIAIFRIILEDITIKIAAGREAVLGDSQSLGFMAGANGMLIGGYLTVKGRSLKEDQDFVKEVKRIWQANSQLQEVNK